MNPPETATTETKSVFISYSRADTDRVEGMALLLEALGHRVFLDRSAIKPGMRWEAVLESGLEGADVLLVYWTKRASRSEWVRKEYEYFHAKHPDRMLVPTLGDETPLAPILGQYQHTDFAPIVNELLALKRRMEGEKASRKAIRAAVKQRLVEAGIDLDEGRLAKVFRMFAPTGLLGLVAAPLMAFKAASFGGLEAAAQLSGAQVALVGAAAVTGAVTVGVVQSPAGDPAPEARPTGTLSATAVLTPGTEPVEAGFWVLSAPDTLGDRRDVTSATSINARFELPEGSYLVRTRYGDAAAEQEVAVEAGDATLAELDLNAGTLSATAVLARGEEPLNAGFWVLSAPDELGDRHKVTSVTSTNARFYLPAGGYLLRTRYGNASGAREVWVEAGATTLEELDLQAGILSATSVPTPGQEPLNAGFWVLTMPDELGDRHDVTSVTSTNARFYLPVGRYLLRTSYANASAEREVAVGPGGVTLEELDLQAGTLSATAVPTRGAEPVQAGFWLLSAPDALGDRHNVNSATSTNARFFVPAGRYLLRSRYGEATAEREVTVTPGGVTLAELNLQAGTLSATALPADGGEPPAAGFWVFSSPDELGDRHLVSSETSTNARFILPAGRYLLRSSYGDATAEREVVVRAGEVTPAEVRLAPAPG